MNTPVKRRFAGSLLLALTALNGCGGGGGGGDSGGAVVVPTDPVNISSANAVQVASVALAATDILSGVDAGSIIGIASGSGGDAPRAGPGFPLVDLVSSQLRHLQPLVPRTGAGVTIAVVLPATTFDCLVSGTVTVSGNIADTTLNTLTAGDVLNGTFNNCDDGDGIVLSGTLSMTVQSFTGDLSAPPYSATVSAGFTSLSLSGAGESLTLNGAVTLSETTQDGVLFTSTLSGNSVSFTESTGDAGTLTDFVSNGTDDLNTLAYSTDASGTLATVNLGGSVRYTTTTIFQGIGTDYPSSGVMVITGAANSSETVTAVDSISVTIDVDADGNGTVDQTINTTWDAL